MSQNRVLLVDDSPSDRLIVKTLVERNGFLTTEVNNAYEALDALDEDVKFSLLIVDLQMPKLPGIELVRRVRRIEKLKTTPVLIMSGRNRPIDVHSAISSGANDYIIKPVDLQIMEEKVKRLISGSSGEWKLYELPADQNTCQVGLLCTTVGLNELGAEISLPFELPANQSLNITLEVLAAKGIKETLVKVDSMRRDPKGLFFYKVSFIGLAETDRKKIRLACREMWTGMNEKKEA